MEHTESVNKAAGAPSGLNGGLGMVVDILEIERVLRYFKAINKSELDDIIWMRGEERLTPSAEQLEEFHYMGLSNRDFPSVIGWMPDDIGIRVTTMTLTKSA